MKKWFRFSLRSFLILVAIVASWLALKVHHVKLQKAVEDRVWERGGDFRYTYEENAYPSTTKESQLTKSLRERFGDECFGKIGYVALSGEDVTNADIQMLARIKSYRWLSFYDSSVTDDGLKHLRNMRQLEWLGLDGSQVTNAGLRQLEGIRQLKNLTLNKLPITDDGVEAIVANFPNLERLHLGGTQITDEGVKTILEGLPKLKRLDLWGTGVTDATCDMLSEEPNGLIGVSVNDTNVSEERAREFKMLMRKRMEDEFRRLTAAARPQPSK